MHIPMGWGWSDNKDIIKSINLSILSMMPSEWIR
ncbi:hypothetical protein SAMN04488505_102520 [Chitinophaga rupis]|uniref:Uncharacterized protein n=1 Tax=Chitinophaga rupis TaxID=573321 RepID=A0A1H7R5P3_9BACT|nr:hypothetical protein SAMN04488505_102520 [Chitinophaga rupis]